MYSSSNGPGSISSVLQDKYSVFDLFHSLALTSQGRRRLREIFARPSIDIRVIKERHQTISDLLDPKNKTSVDMIQEVLKGTRSIQPVLVQIRRGMCLPGGPSTIKQGAWINLRNFCRSVLQLVDVARRLPLQSYSIVKKVRGKS